MLRIVLSLAIGFVSSATWAGIKECNQTKDEKVEDAQGEYDAHKAADASRSAEAGAIRKKKPDMPNSAGDLKKGTAENISELIAALENNRQRKAECQEKCKNVEASKKEEALKAAKECKQKIGEVEAQEKADLAANQKANPEAAKSEEASKDTNKQAQNDKNQMPPIPPMTPPKSDDKSNGDQKQADNSSTPQPAPAATPQSQPSKSDNQSGKDGFQAPKEVAKAVCSTSANPSEIAGCEGFQSAAVTKPVSPFPGNSTATGGGGGSAAGGGGGGGGGINAAQVAAAMANQSKLTESEKDGKNTGLKASQLSLSTDGGGGGGGGGGGSMSDMDFGFKGNGLNRGPSSASKVAGAEEQSLIKNGVAPERFSVVKILESVYQDKCKAGRFLHCGKNP